MNKSLKKCLSLFLAMLMVLTCIPMTVLAEETENPVSGYCGPKDENGDFGKNAMWNYDESTTTLTISGTGEMYNYFIGDRPDWLMYKKYITDVVIEEGITNVGAYSFETFEAITSVTFPDSLTKIGSSAFNGCFYIKEIKIPDSVTRIEQNAFNYCQDLTEIIIPDNVTFIGNGAFQYCKKITEIKIPDKVTEIKNQTFYGCENLTSVILHDGITSFGEGAFEKCSKLPTVTIPSDMTTIPNNLFYGCTSLREIVIPKDVTSIGDNAFRDCSSLTKITIPDGVTSIGKNAFLGCSNLTEITIPDAVTNIGGGAFEKCSSLTSVTIPNGIKSIEDGTFSNCKNLVSITIPDSVTNIDTYAFAGCSKLSSITIPNDVTNIGKYAFYNCSSITNITIPNGVTIINAYAFGKCTNLASITISDNITNIDDYAFTSCSKLTEVTIPDGVTNIGIYAFEKCSKLAEINIPNNVVSIGKGAFSNCTGLTKATISNSVKEIGDSAFSGCSKLTEITIPDSVTSIGKSAFYNCTSLAEANICNSVKEIENNAVRQRSTTKTTMSDLSTSIGESAFSNCSSLTKVTMGNTVTEIGSMAFSGCTKLSEIKFSESLKTIKSRAFTGCSSLAEIVIPDSVTTLEDGAFQACSNLKNATIGKNVKEIHGSMFVGCINLENLKLLNQDVSLRYTSMIIHQNTTLNAYCSNITPENPQYYNAYKYAKSKSNKFVSLGHIGEWVIVSEPTAYKDGSKERVCTVCGAKETKSIPFIPVTFVEITNKENIPEKFVIGETFDLIVTVGPENATEKGYVFKSSDNNIVTVDDNGKITAINGGSAIVTVVTKADITKTDSVEINVEIPVENITIENNKFTLTLDEFGIGSSDTISVIFNPTEPTNKKLVYSVNVPDVVTVDSTTGKVTAIGKGTAIITVKSQDNENAYAEVFVTVNQLAASVTVDKTELVLNISATDKILGSADDNATEKGVIYTSSDENVVKVDTEGNIIATGKGTATITVTAIDGSGKYATVEVTVLQPATSVTIDKSELTLNVGETDKITGTVDENASEKSITYTSSDENIVKVDNEGNVTAIGKGNAIITVTAADGSGVFATVNATIKQPITDIIIPENKNNIVLNIGAETEIGATTNPDVDYSLTYESKDSNIAKITENGNITAVGIGTTTITIKPVAGSDVEKTITVTVREIPNIAINAPTDVKIGDTGEILVIPNVEGSYVTEYEVSDESVVKVDENGNLVAVGKGTTTVTTTVTFEDGTVVKKTITINSVDPNEGKFFCSFCDDYEAMKNSPVGFIYTIVHFFIHMIQSINFAT